MKLEDTSSIVPDVDTTNLYFVLLPPGNPTSNPGELMAGLSEADAAFIRKPRQLNSELSEAALQKNIEKEVLNWRNLQLSGAIGTWTFYILSSTSQDLSKLEAAWHMTIRIPYLEVQHAVPK